MDIVLERILSLIPKKENGDFMHGAKKAFAISIGFKSGEIISDWIAGRSTSYKGHLQEISKVYGVSIDWLYGSDVQKKEPADKSVSRPEDEFMQLFLSLSPEEQQRELAYLRERAAGRGK